MNYPDCYFCIFRELFLFLKYFRLSGVSPDNGCTHYSPCRIKRGSEVTFTCFVWCYFFLSSTALRYNRIVSHFHFLTKYFGNMKLILSLMSLSLLSQTLILTMFNCFQHKKSTEEMLVLWKQQEITKTGLAIQNSLAMLRVQKFIILFLSIVIISITFIHSIVSYNFFCLKLIEQFGFLFTILLTIAGIILLTYGTGMSAASFIYIFFICAVNRMKFVEVTEELKMLLSNPDRIVLLKQIQTRHNNVCHMVEVSDRFVRYYIFLVYALFLPMTCYICHQLLFNKALTTVSLMILVNMVVNMVLFFFALTLVCGAVTSAAKKPRDLLYEILNLDIPSDIRIQAIIFLQRLNGPTIGYTCLDLFVVTNSTLSTTLSFFLTYLLIYIQFMKEDQE